MKSNVTVEDAQAGGCVMPWHYIISGDDRHTGLQKQITVRAPTRREAMRLAYEQVRNPVLVDIHWRAAARSTRSSP